jgi:hypothetical protein
MNTIIASVAVVTSLLGSIVASAQQTDPWIGTWKLNPEKSKGDPAFLPKSRTARTEPASDGAQKHTIDSVFADGRTTHLEVVAKYDGVDVLPVVQPPPSTAKVTNNFRRIDDRSFEVTVKRDGKAAGTTRVVVSPDGKTMTQTTTGPDPQGRTITTVTVLEKQ